MSSKVKRFYCPQCDRRLWHLSKTKDSSFCPVLPGNKNNIEEFYYWQGVLLLTSQEINTRTDLVKQLFCGEHGELWMTIASYD